MPKRMSPPIDACTQGETQRDGSAASSSALNLVPGIVPWSEIWTLVAMSGQTTADASASRNGASRGSPSSDLVHEVRGSSGSSMREAGVSEDGGATSGSW